MLKIVEDKITIAKSYQILTRKLRELVNEELLVKVGHKGASFKRPLSWINKYDFWYFAKKGGYKHWNPFGVGRPKKAGDNNITCVINFLVKGIDRRIGGAFAEDDIGNIYLVHRGKIGGGKKGIGKKLFFEKYPKKNLVTVTDGDRTSKVALIGKLNSPNLVKQIAQFVHKVESIKNSKYKSPHIRQTAILSEPKSHSFNKEFAGIKEYEHKGKRKIESNSVHGQVVNALEPKLRELGFKTANNTYIDLYLYNKLGKINTIFEVKTNTSGTNLYTAVGQLYLNSINLKNKVTLVLVCPKSENTELVGKLNKLNIKVLNYQLLKDKIVFPKLRELFSNH